MATGNKRPDLAVHIGDRECPFVQKTAETVSPTGHSAMRPRFDL